MSDNANALMAVRGVSEDDNDYRLKIKALITGRISKVSDAEVVSTEFVRLAMRLVDLVEHNNERFDEFARRDAIELTNRLQTLYLTERS